MKLASCYADGRPMRRPLTPQFLQPGAVAQVEISRPGLLRNAVQGENA